MYIYSKNKAKAIQQKMFEEIAKKQQKLLTATNDEHEEEEGRGTLIDSLF